MASDKELSDLDLELLGEKPSTPAPSDEHPATSSHTVQGSGKKAPTQAGFTNKSRSSVTPDRVHVFGSVTPVQADFTIKTDHQLNAHGLVLTPKAPPKSSQYRPLPGHPYFQGNIAGPLPGQHQPIFGHPTFHYPTPNPTPLPTQGRPIFSPESFQVPTMYTQGPSGQQNSVPSHLNTPNISENSDSVMADLEETDENESQITRDDVVKLMRKNRVCEKTKEELSKRLSYVESEIVQLNEQRSELERKSKAEMKEISNKLSSTEAENAELHDKYARAEEALRMRVEQAVKDARRAQATEQNLEKLKDEYEALKSAHIVLENKSKTQTNQVVGCEKKVTKTLKEYAEYKTAAEAKEARLLQSNENLKRGLEDSRNFIRSSGIDVRRAEIAEFGAHVDAFEESRQDWVETQYRLEDDLAAVKATLDDREQKILIMEEENKRLNQAKTDLKRANQDLRKAQTVSTVNKVQTSLQDTQTDYSTDEDQSSLHKKPKRSLGEELVRDTSSQSGDDEPSEVEERTVTIRDFNSTSTGDAQTQTEEQETVVLREFKPVATAEAQTQTEEQETMVLRKFKPFATAEAQTQTEEQETIALCEVKSIATAEAQTQTEEQLTMTTRQSKLIATGEGWTQTEAPRFERSAIYSIQSAPVTSSPAPLAKYTQSQGTQTESRPTRSQGVQTESLAVQSQATQTTSEYTQSQGTQTESRLTESQGVQTESVAVQSQATQTTSEYTQAQGTQTESRLTESQGVQTESVAANSEAMQNASKYTQSQGTQTEPRSTQSQGVQPESVAADSEATQNASKTTQSQGVQTESVTGQLEALQSELKATHPQGVQTEPLATYSKATQTEPKATHSAATQTDSRATHSQGVQTEPIATKSKATQTEPEETIVLDGKKSWFIGKYTKAILGMALLSLLLMFLFWAWSQCQAATKERKMWMLANDHAYRLSDEVIRKQAIALLQRTEDRAKLGWLTPEKVMTMHRGAHQAFARKFGALAPTRSISKATLVRSAMAPVPATTRSGVWPAWSDSL